MENFVKRMELEYLELETKVEKLFDFLQSEKFQELKQYEQTLLTIQYCNMKGYLDVLDLRIKNYTEKK